MCAATAATAATANRTSGLSSWLSGLLLSVVLQAALYCTPVDHLPERSGPEPQQHVWKARCVTIKKSPKNDIYTFEHLNKT